jgi:inosine triphosphate pyrophosphatase
MQIYFITGNKNKFEEIKAIIPQVELLDIDLVEIQDVDPEVIIRHKLQEAFKHHPGPFIVEDTSLYLDSLNGLPGPLIKWFMKTIGNEGIYSLADKFGNNIATAKTIIGYAKDNDNFQFFEGSIEGKIVSPRGDNRFGWDPIFQPDGYEKTFAEMEPQEKNKFSMRRLAVNKFKEQL